MRAHVHFPPTPLSLISLILFCKFLFLFFFVARHVLQEILGKARTLLKCLVEAILATVIGVADYFWFLRAAVVAVEHHLGLGVFVFALEAFEV